MKFVPNKNEHASENESNQNSEFEQQKGHEDKATHTNNDTNQTVWRSARQIKPNVRYAEYLYAKMDDKTFGQSSMDKDNLRMSLEPGS